MTESQPDEPPTVKSGGQKGMGGGGRGGHDLPPLPDFFVIHFKECTLLK